MKTNNTISMFNPDIYGLILFGSLFIVFLSLGGCAAGVEQNNKQNQPAYSGDKSFSFKDSGSDWRVDFEKDEISAVYKDGTRIPDSDIEKYEDMIYNKLNDLKSDQKELSDKVYSFHFDADKFKNHMEKFKKDFDSDKFMRFKMEFDDGAFEKSMKELEENLKELKNRKIEIYFDSEKFKEKMKGLEENLKNMPIPPVPPDIDIDVHINMDKFKENMKKFEEEMKENKFMIDSSVFDMSELRENMKDLKKNMGGLKIEMDGLKSEMKKLKNFMSALKSDLVKDGYIGSVDEEFDLKMSRDKTEINDKEVKPEDHKKYLDLYEKYFNKELDGTFKIKRD